jgi:hypothetical protein
MRRAAFLSSFALLLAASPAAAAVITAPNVVEIAAPGSTLEGDLEDNTLIRLFAESTVTLASALTVDVTAPGIYQNGSAPIAASGSIAAGTKVDSYFIHFDPANGTQTGTGSVTFDTDILGVLVYTSTLAAGSDGLLGAPGTLYVTGANRGLEFGPSEDVVTLSSDLRTLTLSLREQSSRVDQLRVVVASPGSLIPEPDTALLFGGGLLALAALRRRR